jgi:ketosteroid isomerase-like protein
VSEVESRVRAIYARFNDGDIEGAAELFHPDIAVHDAAELPGGGSYRGRGEVAGALGDLREMFGGPLVEVEDVRVQGDRAVALVRARGRGRAGGVPIEAEIAHVFALRDGEIVEMRVFLDHAAGLAAAGLQSP